MKFSSRLDWAAPLNPLAAEAERRKAAGRALLDLTESNPTHAGIEYPEKQIAAAFADPAILRYDPDPAGSLSVRELVSALHGHAVSPARVLLTASTSEAYTFLFKLLCDPGDEVLVPRPSYPLFEYLARLENVRLRHYPLFYDHGWHLDLHALEEAASERTRAVVLVNPNNPTGHFLKRGEWRELAALCERRRWAVISDEVFADYGFAPDAERLSCVAANAPVLSFSLSGLSKVAGLPQVKLGWMLVGGPPCSAGDAMKRLELIADTFLSVGTPVQVAAPSLLAAREVVQRQIRARLAENLAFLDSAVRDCPAATLLCAEGGWYATLRVPRTMSEEARVLALLANQDVLVQPGYFYDFETEAFLVLSLLTRPEVFREGVRRLLPALA